MSCEKNNFIQSKERTIPKINYRAAILLTNLNTHQSFSVQLYFVVFSIELILHNLQKKKFQGWQSAKKSADSDSRFFSGFLALRIRTSIFLNINI